jgi:hypothetical protein
MGRERLGGLQDVLGQRDARAAGRIGIFAGQPEAARLKAVEGVDQVVVFGGRKGALGQQPAA